MSQFQPDPPQRRRPAIDTTGPASRMHRWLQWPKSPRRRLGLFAVVGLIPLIVGSLGLGPLALLFFYQFPLGFLAVLNIRAHNSVPGIVAMIVGWSVYVGLVIAGVHARTQRAFAVQFLVFVLLILLNTAGCSYGMQNLDFAAVPSALGSAGFTPFA